MDDAPLNTASEPWAGRAEPLPHAAYPCKCLGKPHQDWTCNRKPPVGKARTQHVYWDHDPAALAVHISTFGASVPA